MTFADWSLERISLASLMWKEGKSASHIADVLNAGAAHNEVKFTRNGVISRMGRSGVESGNPTRHPHKPTPVRRKAAPASLRKPEEPMPEIESLPLPPEPAIATEPRRLTLLQLTDNTCKFPIGDPRKPDFCFCGHPPLEGKPYCAEHNARAYQPVPPARIKPQGSWR